MIGLLDSDILAYEFGGAKTEEGEDLPLNMTIARMYERIEMIQERSGVATMDFYLTGKGNFREQVATIKPYKGNRPKEKSKHWAALRFELEKNCGAEIVEGMEADDAVAIRQFQTNKIIHTAQVHMALSGLICKDDPPNRTAILSRDKDLNMVEGYHYGWKAGNCKEAPLWKQTAMGGLRCFYKQLLTGDTVDNIPGLFGVGVKSTLVSRIDSMDTEWDMFVHVREKYQDRFGAYADQFILENGMLLYMLQEEGKMWEVPIGNAE